MEPNSFHELARFKCSGNSCRSGRQSLSFSQNQYRRALFSAQPDLSSTRESWMMWRQLSSGWRAPQGSFSRRNTEARPPLRRISKCGQRSTSPRSNTCCPAKNMASCSGMTLGLPAPELFQQGASTRHHAKTRVFEERMAG